MLKRIKLILNLWRVVPLWWLCHISKTWMMIHADLKRWKEIDKKVCSDFCFFGDTLLAKKEFRNLLQYRLHYAKSYVADFFTRIFFPPMETLMIRPDMQAGGGLYIQHRFATIIAAERVGENFGVNQQVTIGYKNGKAPIIKDNVNVFAGAIIIGGVTINSGSKVGAGAIVTNNIPEDATVISPKARIYSNTLIKGIETS